VAFSVRLSNGDTEDVEAVTFTVSEHWVTFFSSEDTVAAYRADQVTAVLPGPPPAPSALG
jgi:hypothetical protein